MTAENYIKMTSNAFKWNILRFGQTLQTVLTCNTDFEVKNPR